MKKLLVLMLVLAIGSAASAGLVIVGPGLDEQVREVTLKPSETIVLGVTALGGITGFEFEIRLSNDQAVILDDVPVFPTPFMFTPYVKSRSPHHIDVTGGDFFPKTDPVLPIIEGIVIHCTELTDVVVDLIATGANNLGDGLVEPGTIMDSIVIHQIPEPMSLALLGLGGLLLRRRK